MEELLSHEAMASLSGIRFPEWFTWCQTCRHGGHAHHLSDWFETQDECGVAGCSCRCYAKDQAVYGGHVAAGGNTPHAGLENAMLLPIGSYSGGGPQPGSGSGYSPAVGPVAGIGLNPIPSQYALPTLPGGGGNAGGAQAGGGRGR